MHSSQRDYRILDRRLKLRRLQHFALPEGGGEEAGEFEDRVGSEEVE